MAKNWIILTIVGALSQSTMSLAEEFDMCDHAEISRVQNTIEDFQKDNCSSANDRVWRMSHSYNLASYERRLTKTYRGCHGEESTASDAYFNSYHKSRPAKHTNSTH